MNKNRNLIADCLIENTKSYLQNHGFFHMLTKSLKLNRFDDDMIRPKNYQNKQYIFTLIRYRGKWKNEKLTVEVMERRRRRKRKHHKK